MPTPQRVLFLCDGNAARSQMAEGLLRALGGPGFEVHSAGLEPRPLHPLAVEAMAEAGIDIAGQRSKHLNEFLDTRFDRVITLCDRTRESCPDFPRDNETLHWAIDDPTAAPGTQAEQLAAFRRARDAIRREIERWLATTTKPHAT
ncbi:arsenate reductase [Sulfuritortus calidifontis]|uniref:Arsenate reductase n=1 Tax=Sulfuritortus calidifontis TaxID=1914471 RepID=A0A4R3JWY1_9PROT|nr:arsenate reductase ArsC [Sulfuritortus calidifontis]TCS71742.1 arsenate reductase [Sulfuritortus calidifontis]